MLSISFHTLCHDWVVFKCYLLSKFAFQEEAYKFYTHMQVRWLLLSETSRVKSNENITEFLTYY